MGGASSKSRRWGSLHRLAERLWYVTLREARKADRRVPEARVSNGGLRLEWAVLEILRRPANSAGLLRMTSDGEGEFEAGWQDS